ncbi:MAG: glycoside hydrolase family 92 protein [Flavobacteriia bacterium]|nr:glycoside hydrolase family 92 protein [Flavobacteriia bacterium]
MNKFLVLFTILCSYLSTAQDPNVNKIKEAQDSRKKYINPENSNTIHSTPKATQKTQYVNPFIGTGGHGHTYPGVSMPFGMMQLSPDSRFDGWDGCSGYHYSDSIIYGFSHTHLSGVGVPDYCDLLIVPQSGKLKTIPGYKEKGGFGSKFSHQNEKASPGLYEVYLDDSKINVRLTSSERAGIHEYTFLEKKGKKYILIDLDHRDKLLGSDFKIENNTSLSGYRISEAWASEQHFYFSIEVNMPFSKSKLITKNGQHKLVLEFPETTEKIYLKVGMSAVDIEGAKLNLKSEISDFNFAAIHSKAVQKWSDELNKIDFYSDDKNEMITFYTALYHSFLNPNLFSDVDNRYRGRDNLIHTLPNSNEHQYTVFSLWDTYRATHPLFTITQQQRTNEFINTFLRQYEEGKDLPVWELAGNETECMIGYHSVSVITDAFIKNIQQFDERKALEAMIATSNFNELGKKQFNLNGFISLADEPESVSKALEYAYDDYCISQMAAATQNNLQQHATIVKEYSNRANNFINYFDPSTKFMRARRNGLWYSPFDPNEVNFNYTEANSWQYSLYAPHAIGVLTNLIGSKNELESWLDRLFNVKSGLSGREQVDITGLIGQYAHGNEPSHHIAYLYNYTNSPSKTQFYIDKILKEMYSNNPDGLAGNEDCGQMSSWYVLSAMGIYQIAPGNPYFEIGRPIGRFSEINLENGKSFKISTINNSKSNCYIQKITLNGKDIQRLFLSFDEINQGGEIVIEMGALPNSEVNKYEHAPSIQEVSKSFVPIPHFKQENRTFIDTLEIAIGYPIIKNRNFEIKYTLDGTEPTLESPTYIKPFNIKETTKINIALIDNDSKTLGKSTMNEFVKRDSTIHLKLETPFANQYAAGGESALIDGITGGTEYRTGDFQGYYGKNLIAEITFNTPKSLTEIGLNCLEDTKSWIFYPQSISFEISYDGVHFVKLKTLEIAPSKDQITKSTNLFKVQIANKEKVKKIKVTAINYGKCPTWHLGAGFDTWLFADEIIFR